MDSLKLLGFHYATNAGISINIEDLRTPDIKTTFLKNAEEEINFVSEQWALGFVSDAERFQKIIDTWNFTTESLKDKIVEYYKSLIHSTISILWPFQEQEEICRKFDN